MANYDPRNVIILEDINRLYGTSIYATDLEVSEVILVDPTVTTIADPVLRNSKMRLTYRGPHPITFSTVVNYNRIALSDIGRGQSAIFSGVTNSHELVPLINARWNTGLMVEDILNVSYDLSSGFPSRQTLTAADSSQRFFGELEIVISAP